MQDPRRARGSGRFGPAARREAGLPGAAWPGICTLEPDLPAELFEIQQPSAPTRRALQGMRQGRPTLQQRLASTG